MKISKRGEPEKNFRAGETKRGERFSKIKGGTQLFKLNLGTEKNKNKDFCLETNYCHKTWTPNMDPNMDPLRGKY